MQRVALITGITGQDGTYLARHLLAQGYRVHGLKRRASSSDPDRVNALRQGPNGDRLTLHYGDMTDAASVIRVLQEARPSEVYNLAAQSHVHVSFEKPAYTAQVNALGALHLLEGIRLLGMKDEVRFYQASTSEMYGAAVEPAARDDAVPSAQPLRDRKVFAHHTTVNYREAYGFHASNGICFNHEGPQRGENFVTRKITRAVAARAAGGTAPLMLGNLDAQRDWGHVQDFVEGMQLMLRQDAGDDYVLATGASHTVRDFADCAFRHIRVDLAWEEGPRRNGPGPPHGRGGGGRRSAVLPPGRGELLEGRSDEGAGETRLAAADRLRAIGARDGGSRSRGGRRDARASAAERGAELDVRAYSSVTTFAWG